MGHHHSRRLEYHQPSAYSEAKKKELATHQPSKISKFPGRPIAKVLSVGGGEEAQFEAHNRRVAAAKTKAAEEGERMKNRNNNNNNKKKKKPPGLISPPTRTESIFAMEDPDRLLYDGDREGGDGNDEDDEEPITCFYVEKRGVLRRGVGAAGGGAGVGGRRHCNPNVAPVTGRPLAPGGMDDAQPFDRCFAHGAGAVPEEEEQHVDEFGGGRVGTPGTRPDFRRRRRRRPAPPPGMDNVFARLQYGTPHGPKQPNVLGHHDDNDNDNEYEAYGDDGRPAVRLQRETDGYERFGATEPACVVSRPGGGGGTRRERRERVPRLVDLAVAALAEAFSFITRLPPLPPELINEALSRAKLDRRVLALALGAGATRLHVYDFWELCHSFPAS